MITSATTICPVAAATSSAAVLTQNLSKQYGREKVLDNLNLAVPRNSIFGFLGPNGAGKSTTIKLLLGLIQATGGGAQIGHTAGDHADV